MNVLKFRRGYKNWDMSYNVELDFEYTADLKKRITHIILHQLSPPRSVRIPWIIFQPYLNGKEGVYIDSSGLKIRAINGEIHISDSGFLKIKIHEDQRNAIKLAEKRVRRDISSSVENILKRFARNRAENEFS